jgi:phytoene dehydrogenase-like protein
MMQKDKEYDAVIIGAGISGLVCGCYLAKAGMKVLMAEQHFKPGGYCTSFKRQGYTFDAAADCFGGYREGGTTRKILSELGIDTRIDIVRPDPTNIIITPDYRIFFWIDLDKTVKELQTAFPDEKNSIHDFFQYANDPRSASFVSVKNWTFKKLLDHYFTNDKLKAILSIPLLAVGGLPPSRMSAFIGIKLYSEFLIDGGYYPKGGMQVLSDAFAAALQRMGGELRLSCSVQKITVKNNRITGVILEKGGFTPAKYVISNCDARQTFLKLLGKDKLPGDFYFTLKNLTHTVSNFILYAGMDQSFDPPINTGAALFYSDHYDMDKAYLAAQKGDIENYGGYALRIADDKSTMNAIIPAPYKSKGYWQANKHKFLNRLLDRITQYSIPNLTQHVIFAEGASPATLYRYTLNYKGASYGWAGTPSQLALPDFKKPSFMKGLYLTGHWTTLGIGISGVAYVGYDTARLILRQEKIIGKNVK